MKKRYWFSYAGFCPVLLTVLLTGLCNVSSAHAQTRDTTGTEPQAQGNGFKLAEIIVLALGSGGTVALLVIGLRQYKRTDLWKRSEFVAKEVEAFQKDPAVRNAFAMLDWHSRYINLFLKNEPERQDLVFVNRELLWKALLPYPIKYKNKKYIVPDKNGDDEIAERSAFRLKEVAIRDTFDVFLGYLQRFSHFIVAGLVTPEEIGIYLKYWVEAIGSGEEPGDIWRLVLLAYINFYEFDVQALFEGLGYYITPEGCCYQRTANEVQKQHPELACDIQSLFGTRANCCTHG